MQLNSLREVYRYRDLLYMLTWKDIRVRYKQSIMGLMWAILMPLAIIMAGVVVRVAMATVSDEDLAWDDLSPVFAKSVVWAFFVSSIRFGTNCLVSNNNLVTKIYFPKVILPLSAVLGHFFDFLIASCMLALFFSLNGLTWHATALWIPLLVVCVLLLTSGLSIFLSAAGLFFRDIKYLVEIFVMFAIFVTPVFYDASMLGKWETLALLNPIASLLEGVADALVRGRAPDAAWLAYSVAASVGVFAASLAFFRRVEPAFAECI